MKKTKLENILIITEAYLGGIDELVYNPITNNPEDEFDKGSDGGVVKDKIRWDNHDDHLHIGTTNREVTIRLIDKSKEFNLTSTENPYAKNDQNSKVNDVHVDGSFHYRQFQGEPSVGAGTDFSGTKDNLRKFIRWINANYKNVTYPKDVVSVVDPKTNQKTETNTDTKTNTESPVTTTTTTASSAYASLNPLKSVIDSKFLEDLGNQGWNNFINAMGESENNKSNLLNEEIVRIKKMMDL